MSDILTIILPVFIVLAFGYSAVWRGLFSNDHVDGLMQFVQTFAIPLLLFRAISTLDLGQNFDAPLLISFYAGVVAAFSLGLLGARVLFARPWEDCVAIAFACLFSNTLLLGLPITERAFGPDALLGNYTIIAIHAPFGYMLGITAMELARAQNAPLRSLPRKVVKAMFSNALVVGITLGIIVNLANIPSLRRCLVWAGCCIVTGPKVICARYCTFARYRWAFIQRLFGHWATVLNYPLMHYALLLLPHQLHRGSTPMSLQICTGLQNGSLHRLCWSGPHYRSQHLRFGSLCCPRC